MLDTGNSKFFMFDGTFYHSVKSFKAIPSLSLNNLNPKTIVVAICQSKFLSHAFLEYHLVNYYCEVHILTLS